MCFKQFLSFDGDSDNEAAVTIKNEDEHSDDDEDNADSVTEELKAVQTGGMLRPGQCKWASRR